MVFFREVNYFRGTGVGHNFIDLREWLFWGGAGEKKMLLMSLCIQQINTSIPLTVLVNEPSVPGNGIGSALWFGAVLTFLIPLFSIRKRKPAELFPNAKNNCVSVQIQSVHVYF